MRVAYSTPHKLTVICFILHVLLLQKYHHDQSSRVKTVFLYGNQNFHF